MHMHHQRAPKARCHKMPLGVEVTWDLRRSSDFDRISRTVTRSDIAESIIISSDLARHRAGLAELIERDVDRIYLHCVGRDQVAFLHGKTDFISNHTKSMQRLRPPHT